MKSLNITVFVALSMLCGVNTLCATKGETKAFAYIAGGQCANDMLTSLVDLAQSDEAQSMCIEEFIERYSRSFGTEHWDVFLKGFYQEFKDTDIHQLAEQVQSDRFISRLLVRGHQLMVDLLPYIMKHHFEWMTSWDSGSLSSHLEQALLIAASHKYNAGSKRYNDLKYIVKTFWRNY